MRIELFNQGLRAAADTAGGELVSLRDSSGTEYIWSGDPAYWPGVNPVLFPIVGSLRDDTAIFDGVTYHMTRHGFARQGEFTVAAQTDSRVALELRESPATLARYPYPFSLQIIHQLYEDGFSTGFRVENTGGKDMPFCIGGHTAFRCPLYEGERFEDYQIVFDQPEALDTLLLSDRGLIRRGCREPLLEGQDSFNLDYSDFARLDTIILEGPRSTGVSLRHRDTGRGVHMDFSGFPMIAFWTRGDLRAPFVCLEPWHGCAAMEDDSGVFEEKPHCIVLRPGEVRELEYRVSLR